MADTPTPPGSATPRTPEKLLLPRPLGDGEQAVSPIQRNLPPPGNPKGSFYDTGWGGPSRTPWGRYILIALGLAGVAGAVVAFFW